MYSNFFSFAKIVPFMR